MDKWTFKPWPDSRYGSLLAPDWFRCDESEPGDMGNYVASVLTSVGPRLAALLNERCKCD